MIKMLYKEKPADFNPKFEVVSCFVEHQNEILLLLRQDHKPQPNTLWVPAGKVDLGETIRKAMKREGDQETKINLWGAKYIDVRYVRYDEYDFVYHMFKKTFKEKPQVTINPEEHKEYKRIHPKKALEKNLIQDLDECIRIVYKETRE